MKGQCQSCFTTTRTAGQASATVIASSISSIISNLQQQQHQHPDTTSSEEQADVIEALLGIAFRPDDDSVPGLSKLAVVDVVAL